MRVLFGVAGDFHYLPSGESIQVLKTKEYLERLGVRADVLDASVRDVRGYDIVHLFNLNKAAEIAKLGERAKTFHIPVVLSPIYWNLDEYESKVLLNSFLKRRVLHLVIGFAERSRLLRNIIYGAFGGPLQRIRYGPIHREKQKQCLAMVDLVLPNALSEQRVLEEDFGIFGKYSVVPNAVETSITPSDRSFLLQKYQLPEQFILSAARIEYRKNQLSLIKALKELRIPVVLAGQVNPVEKSYWWKCLNEGNGLVRYLGHLSQNDVYGLMRMAKAHVLPSWFETPGLSSLEAGFNDCQVVTTERGSTREYFGDLAHYCDPESIDSIREAVMSACSAPKDMSRLKKNILRNYTWEQTAEATVVAYHRVLSQTKHNRQLLK
jgi:glycosyltransferase involved in cell wall biosynthesis